MGCWEGKQNLPVSYQGLSAKNPVVSQRLLPHCCQDSAVISSIWQAFGQIMCPWLGRPGLCGHAGCFFPFFLPMASFNLSPWFSSLAFWLAADFSLPLSFTQQSKLWLCKELPAKNPSKHLVLKAGKLPQGSSYLLITCIIWLLCQCLIYRKSRTQEFDMMVRIVHVSMPKDHWGVCIYWFRVVQSAWVFCYMPEDLPTSWRFYTLTLHLKFFLPITSFGQCKFPWNHPENHWWEQQNKIHFCTHNLYSFIWQHNEIQLLSEGAWNFSHYLNIFPVLSLVCYWKTVLSNELFVVLFKWNYIPHMVLHSW